MLSSTYKEVFVSIDVTFYEQNSYFSQPNSQKELISSLNDDDVGAFLLDLPSANSLPPVTDSPSSSNNLPENMRFNQVYSRRKKSDTDPELVQESSPNSATEVCSEHEISASQSVHNNLPIAIRKGTRACTKRPLYPMDK